MIELQTLEHYLRLQGTNVCSIQPDACTHASAQHLQRMQLPVQPRQAQVVSHMRRLCSGAMDGSCHVNVQINLLYVGA